MTFSSQFLLFSPKIMNNSSLGHESLPQKDTAKQGPRVLYGTPVHIYVTLRADFERN